jgi:hypothetical protein
MPWDVVDFSMTPIPHLYASEKVHRLDADILTCLQLHRVEYLRRLPCGAS